MSREALTPPSLDRTPSNHTRYVTPGVWCYECDFEGKENQRPVRLVIFDCDETLTLSTMMPRDQPFEVDIGWSLWPEFITASNFESPFLEGSRVEKLKGMLSELRENGQVLAVLTRNTRGSVACLNLLLMAGLAEHFSAVWCMAKASRSPSGAYLENGRWKQFTAPVAEVFDHKADVIAHIVADPSRYFPQLAARGGGGLGAECLSGLSLEQVVLVDDVRTNFQSYSPKAPKILRYCKVARYDAHLSGIGFQSDMGGLGAKTDKDYKDLVSFVKNPSNFKAVLVLQCVQMPYDGDNDSSSQPVNLVVFDFDETLSNYTFMPEEGKCCTDIGYFGRQEGMKERFVKFNFESPFVEGVDRVAELRKMLQRIRDGEDPNDEDSRRTLAVLTTNEAGAVAVLNLLMMAGLDSCFSAVWTLQGDTRYHNGVYLEGGTWKPFELPKVERKERSPVKVLKRLLASPSDYFPQLRGDAGGTVPIEIKKLPSLRLSGIVLVDDDRSHFRYPTEELASAGSCPQGSPATTPRDEVASLLRFCKVARYDADKYHDLGLLHHMGGIGAKSATDYEELVRFVTQPTLYRYKSPSDMGTTSNLLVSGFFEDAETPIMPSDLRASGGLERYRNCDEFGMKQPSSLPDTRCRSLP